MTPAFLGIDIGTSGIRGCCIDKNAVELASYAVSMDPPKIDDGRSSQDPDIWWQLTKEVITGLTSSLDEVVIEAIAIDGTSGTVLLTDEDGTALSDALMYNDQRCLDESRQISDVAPGDCAAHGASSGLAKLLYLYKQHPLAKHLCHQADWISAKLTGSFGISDENNCLKTGYDPVSRCWPEYFQRLGIAEAILPKVVSPGTCIGHIEKSLSKSLGLTEQCKVIAGTTDSIAAFIATGAHQIGTGVTSLGSTLALKIITAKPIFSAEYGVYSHRLGDFWLAGGASNSGGRVLQQFFSQKSLDELTPALDDKHLIGLNYYPLPARGERFPINDPEMEPLMPPRSTNDVDFFQALLEGIANIEKLGYEKLGELGASKLTAIITSGGGSRNLPWTKIREKIINAPITKAQHTEASYGAALLAMQGHTQSA